MLSYGSFSRVSALRIKTSYTSDSKKANYNPISINHCSFASSTTLLKTTYWEHHQLAEGQAIGNG